MKSLITSVSPVIQALTCQPGEEVATGPGPLVAGEGIDDRPAQHDEIQATPRSLANVLSMSDSEEDAPIARPDAG